MATKTGKRVGKILFRKLEEAIRESGNPTQKPAPDMERQVTKSMVRIETYVFVSGIHESQDEGGVPELHCQADLACEAAVKWSTRGRICRSWGPWDEPA